jgi:hypothetical protein
MAAADATLSSSDRQTAFSGENNRRQRAAGLQPEPFRQSSGRMENLLLLLPNRPQRVLVRYGRICSAVARVHVIAKVDAQIMGVQYNNPVGLRSVHWIRPPRLARGMHELVPSRRHPLGIGARYAKKLLMSGGNHT